MKKTHGLILVTAMLVCGCSKSSVNGGQGAPELVGKWTAVGDSYSYKSKVIEFFDDGVVYMESTREYGDGGSYRLLPDGRVRLLISLGAIGFGEYKDGTLTVQGVKYQKVAPASK